MKKTETSTEFFTKIKNEFQSKARTENPEYTIDRIIVELTHLKRDTDKIFDKPAPKPKEEKKEEEKKDEAPADKPAEGGEGEEKKPDVNMENGQQEPAKDDVDMKPE